MTAKKSAEVLIDGKVYTLSGYEEEGYLQKVGSYINNKLNEFNEMEEFRRLSRNRRFYISHIKAVGPDGITRNLQAAMEVIVR